MGKVISAYISQELIFQPPHQDSETTTRSWSTGVDTFSFSVKNGVTIPPSLKNIFKELQNDMAFKVPTSGNLELWAKQGVLLLNTTLTVRAHKPGSHQKKGWETFTDKIISLISEKHEHIVFILWGNFAQQKIKLIDEKKHLIIKSVHPSPFSARNGFFGSKPFSKCNEYLTSVNKENIDWNLADGQGYLSDVLQDMATQGYNPQNSIKVDMAV